MSDSTVRGCVWAAAGRIAGVPPAQDLLDTIEGLYQAHSRELGPLVGTNRIWERLIELYHARQGDQPTLFDAPAHVPSFEEAIPDPLTVPCDHCGAEAGQRCVRPSEHKVFGQGVHAIRRSDAAQAARRDGSVRS
jgi:hypothetical protein